MLCDDFLELALVASGAAGDAVLGVFFRHDTDIRQKRVHWTVDNLASGLEHRA
jgi:hypothetical protein